MISVKPVKDENFTNDIIAAYKAIDGEKAVLLAEENGIRLGYIVVSLAERRMSVLKIELYFKDETDSLNSDSMAVADLLIRAAASYAINRSIFVVYGVNNEDFYIYQRLGHKIIGNIALIDLPRIMGNCDKCKK